MAACFLLLLIAGAFACNNTNEVSCKTQSDCRSLNTCIDTCCVHKDLMPLSSSESGGTFLIFLMAGVAHAGGVGGGPIMTTLELLLFYFEAKVAIPLTQCVIVSGGIISVGIRIMMRHPTKNRPQLDYHSAMIIIPPILIGSTFGTMANKVLPNWLILALLTILLVILTWITFRNGIKAYKRETLNKQQKKVAQQPELKPMESDVPLTNLEIGNRDAAFVSRKDSIEAPIFPLEDKAVAGTENLVVEGQTHIVRIHESDDVEQIAQKPEISQELQEIYNREAKQFPTRPVAWIAFCVIYVALGLSIRGGSGTSFAGIVFCGSAFKIFFGLWSAGLLLLCFPAVLYLLHLQKTYERLGYDFDEFDIKWTKLKCFMFWMAGLFAGFGGSMLGFGGSLVLAPLLVQYKMRAPCIVPTTALISLINGAISVMQYAEQKQLIYAYGGWVAAFAFLGAGVGVGGITVGMKKLGRPSVLVFTLVVILVIAMFLVPIYTLVDIIQQEQNGKEVYGFSPYC